MNNRLLSICLLGTLFLQGNLWATADWDRVTHRIGNTTLHRMRPRLQGILVEGADKVIMGEYNAAFLSTQKPALKPHKTFRLALQHALQQPIFQHLSPRHAQQVWLNRFGQLEPAYKVRVAGNDLNSLQDIWVDASTGHILKRRPVLRFAPAHIRVLPYPPDPIKPLADSLQNAELNDVDSRYFSVKNCCVYLACDDGSETCANPRCSIDFQEAIFVHHKPFILPFNFQTVFVDAVACRYENTPYMTSSPEPNDKDLPLADFDDFSPLQAHYGLEKMFTYIRKVSQNPKFCLRDTAQHCDDNGQPAHPLAVLVNVHFPDLLLGPAISYGLEEQLQQGKGTQEQPAIFTGLMRIENAAFVPASGEDMLLSPTPDDVVGELLKPYDQLIFGQGDADYAYDQSVVSHELMHVVTATLSGGLGIAFAEEFGTNDAPGALDEAISDYFAASLLNTPHTGSYVAPHLNETEELRNVDNIHQCPDHIVGEVHEDSKIFSGALWELRQDIQAQAHQTGVEAFDEAILMAIGLTQENESPEHFANSLLTAMHQNPSLHGFIPRAEQILAKRGISSCLRVFPLIKVSPDCRMESKTKNAILLESPLDFGIDNALPGPVQFEIDTLPGQTELGITFELHMHDNSLANSNFEDNFSQINPIRFFVSEAGPTKWSYENNQAIPDSYAMESMAAYNGTHWEWHYPIKPSPQARRFFIAMASIDNAYVMKHITAQESQLTPPQGASCALSPIAIKSSGCQCAEHGQPASISDVLLICLLFVILNRKHVIGQQPL